MAAPALKLRTLVVSGAVAFAVFGGALAWLARPTEAPRTITEEVAVQTGDLPLVQRELGFLAPRDPVIVRCPFEGKIQWIVEDGTWVEAGEPVFFLGDEEEQKRLAELRNRLVQQRVDHRLAVMRREQADATENPKVAKAERVWRLADLRHRILTTPPKAGLELVRLDAELRPLAERTEALRAQAETTQDAYQKALDVYLDILDQWQSNRYRIQRGRARIDELEARLAAATAGSGQADTDTQTLDEAQAELAAEQRRTANLSTRLAKARAERDRLRPARDAAATALAQAEEAEAPLRVAIEVEKRGLALARLQLDERQMLASLGETRRRTAEARVAAATGSIARAELERQEEELTRQENELAILKSRLHEAERGPDEHDLAESTAQLDQAAAALAEARAARARSVQSLDLDVERRRIEMERTTQQVRDRQGGFPGLIEGGIRFAERALDDLGPEETAARAELEAEIRDLKTRLEAARAAPPNRLKAPVAGIARVMRQDDRHRQAGDNGYEFDPLVSIYPPQRMDVLVRVNEADVRHLKTGQAATMRVGVLGGLRLDGRIAEVAGVGKDKYSRPEFRGQAGFADIVDFEVRITPTIENKDFRQGMAVEVEIELDRRSGVLHLPRAAVQGDATAGWRVVRPGGRVQPVQGEPWGPDRFIITQGLAAGELVAIERTRNR